MCWLYDPKFCDGQPCYHDCDSCPIKEDILEAEWKSEQEIKLEKWIERIGGKND